MLQNIENTIDQICKELRLFCDGGIVSMSGGADSTLVAILAKLSFGAENVYTLHLPYGETDESKFNRNSWNVATKLGVHKVKISISDLANSIDRAVEQSFLESGERISRVNSGNSRSRSRTCVAYGVCHHIAEKSGKRMRVIGTGNLSEDFIGYDTKGGDALCDIFPIGQLFKSEVYQILDHFAKQGVIDDSMIDRIPSAGLWANQTDEAELGYSYDQMETAIRRIQSPEFDPTLITDDVVSFVWQRHLAHKHKHEAPPVIQIR